MSRFAFQISFKDLELTLSSSFGNYALRRENITRFESKNPDFYTFNVFHHIWRNTGVPLLSGSVLLAASCLILITLDFLKVPLKGTNFYQV